jgi:hypothetical protein
MEDYECHVCLVLEKIQEIGPHVKLEKGEFHQFEVEFLGYTILDMTFKWILLKFRPLSIGLLRVLFKMSNAFLNLPTFIDISLPNILQ